MLYPLVIFFMLANERNGRNSDGLPLQNWTCRIEMITAARNG
jgi:hypothetical protein